MIDTAGVLGIGRPADSKVPVLEYDRLENRVRTPGTVRHTKRSCSVGFAE